MPSFILFSVVDYAFTDTLHGSEKCTVGNLIIFVTKFSGKSRHKRFEYSYINAIKIRAERVSVVPLMTNVGYTRNISPHASHFISDTFTGVEYKRTASH